MPTFNERLRRMSRPDSVWESETVAAVTSYLFRFSLWALAIVIVLKGLDIFGLRYSVQSSGDSCQDPTFPDNVTIARTGVVRKAPIEGNQTTLYSYATSCLAGSASDVFFYAGPHHDIGSVVMSLDEKVFSLFRYMRLRDCEGNIYCTVQKSAGSSFFGGSYYGAYTLKNSSGGVIASSEQRQLFESFIDFKDPSGAMLATAKRTWKNVIHSVLCQDALWVVTFTPSCKQELKRAIMTVTTMMAVRGVDSKDEHSVCNVIYFIFVVGLWVAIQYVLLVGVSWLMQLIVDKGSIGDSGASDDTVSKPLVGEDGDQPSYGSVEKSNPPKHPVRDFIYDVLVTRQSKPWTVTSFLYIVAILAIFGKK